MTLPLYLVVHTANILGIFNDPFEFSGDYGPEVNPVRETVFELIVSKEAITRNLTDVQVRELMDEENPDTQTIHRFRQILVNQAIERDREHGPTFAELITSELLNELTAKQEKLKYLGFKDTDLQAMRNFITRHAHQKAFRFLKNNPPDLLKLDKTLRDNARAEAFKEKLIAADSGFVFTQESDTFVPQVLTQDGLYHPVSKQNPADCCYVFLRSNIWDANYEIIPILSYKGYEDGAMSVVLATRIDNQDKFLRAACHGHSTKPEDGRLQITLVMEQFQRLSQMPKNKGLQLLIGIDANTKSEKDVEMLHEHLNRLGLVGTSVGPTTVKRRMVTAQHSKMGRFATDEEDFLVTLKVENGGRFSLSNPTVGFSKEKPDVTRMLPIIDNPSDHYPVGATLW